VHSFYRAIERFDIVLGSGSPRRHELLTRLGLRHRVVRRDTDESFPEGLVREGIALYLAGKKADAYADLLVSDHSLVITADTIVCLDDALIGKPAGEADARRMLRRLSGRQHDVFTGVCLSVPGRRDLFHAASQVRFKALSDDEIDYYVGTGEPLDKAGAYGVQDWFGLTAIERIEGSFYNVMGLPVKEVYERLQTFF
jgi:septum formation protein